MKNYNVQMKRLPTRRDLLHAIGIATVGTSGCITLPGAEDPNFRRKLHVLVVSTEFDTSWWRLQVEIQTGNTGRFRSSDEGIFRDVRIIGRAKEGVVVCQRSVGDFGPGLDQRQFEIKCPVFPYTIQLVSAGAPPCDEHTQIQALRYTAGESPEALYEEGTGPSDTQVVWDLESSCEMSVPSSPTSSSTNRTETAAGDTPTPTSGTDT